MSNENVIASELAARNQTIFFIDGWIEAGSFLSLYGQQGTFNFGPTDAVSAQEIHLNQAYLKTSIQHQNENMKMAINIDNLVGTDWNNSYSYGFLDNAFRWNQIGWNFPQAFMALETNDIKIEFGKMYTPYGYEDVQATERPLYSTGYLYNFIYPTTQSGLTLTWNMGKGINIYQGIINAPDLWVFNRFEPNYISGLTVENNEGLYPNSFSLFLNYGRGLMRINTVMMSGVPVERTDLDSFATPILAQILLLSENWQIKLPDNLTINIDLTQGAVNDARTFDDGMVTNDGSWIGGSLWLEKELSETMSTTLRCEWLDNTQGIATGYHGSLFETTWGLSVKAYQDLMIRPEIRYDRSLDASPFLDDSSRQLFSMNIDAIIKY